MSDADGALFPGMFLSRIVGLLAATGRSRPSNGQCDDRLSGHPAAEELGPSLRS
jgi:hypothetical protein